MEEQRRQEKSLIIFTHTGEETGFRLGGAPTHAVENEDELNHALAALLDRKESGLIALPEKMRPWVSPKNLRRIAASLFPLFISYPGRERFVSPHSLEEEIGMMVKKTLGYRIRIEL